MQILNEPVGIELWKLISTFKHREYEVIDSIEAQFHKLSGIRWVPSLGTDNETESKCYNVLAYSSQVYSIIQLIASHVVAEHTKTIENSRRRNIRLETFRNRFFFIHNSKILIYALVWYKIVSYLEPTSFHKVVTGENDLDGRGKDIDCSIILTA